MKMLSIIKRKMWEVLSKKNKNLNRLRGDEKFLSELLEKYEEDASKIDDEEVRVFLDKYDKRNVKDVLNVGVIRDALNDVSREIRDIENQNLQKSINTTQAIVAIAMVITVAISFGSLLYTSQTYEINKKPFVPKLFLSAYCSQEDLNNTIRIESLITNTGKDAVIVKRQVTSKNIDLGVMSTEGRYFNERVNQTQTLKLDPAALLGEDELKFTMNLDTRDRTVFNFEIYFNYTCVGIDSQCIIMGPNEFNCTYERDGDVYKRTNQAFEIK